MYVPLKKLDETAVVPGNAYPGDAGVDLHALEPYTLQPFERAMVRTGISLAIPEGYAGLVVPRSGLAIKRGLSVVNAPGLIDSNYRGEICVLAINLDPKEPIVIEKGDRIAQLVITKVETPSFGLVDELEETSRGQGGFGSSGVNMKV